MTSKKDKTMDAQMLINGRIACMTEGRAPYGLINDGAIALRNGKIAWVGKASEVPEAYRQLDREDLEGRLVTPALIDCHTHLIYGGDRASEFEMRLAGASYEEIAKAGGGILSTVKATREASAAELADGALKRVDLLIGEGVGTVEVKSGYGLDLDTELKMLGVAREIALRRELRVVATFLGAHTVPPEFSGRPDDYIDFICEKVLPLAHDRRLVDIVDAFCERIAFTPEQVSRLFVRAKGLGLPVRLHAEQLSNMDGAKMAARHQALSADHLEYLDEEGVAAMAKADIVAVLLPGAFYMLGQDKPPPVKALRQQGVAMAVATDCNPGSSPLFSLLLAVNMSCVLFGLTAEEALAGATRNAAKALGLKDTGTLEVGKRADLAIWNVERPAEIAYGIGANPLKQRIVASGAEQ